MTAPGHNSIAVEQLRAIVERIERVNAEIADLKQDSKEILLEAKGNGFDVKAIRKIVAIRSKDPEKLAQEESVVDTYAAALGMQLTLFGAVA